VLRWRVFGFMRMSLALAVMFSHLVPFMAGQLNWLGHYAVWSFFCLSGYLMTLVLNQRYGFGSDGLLRYAANRALRIYPPYLVALAAMTGLLALRPDWTAVLTHTGLPYVAGDWIRNVALLDLNSRMLPAPILPASWSLSIELYYYVLMALLLSRSRVTVLLWLVAAVTWAAWANTTGVAAHLRVTSPAACALPFALGATVYFVGQLFSPSPTEPRAAHSQLPNWLLPLAVVVALVNAGTAWTWPDLYSTPLLLHAAASSAVILALAGVARPKATSIMTRLDRQLGDLSYPLFLLHMPVSIVVAAALATFTESDLGLGERPALFVLAVPVVLMVSLLLRRVVELPVEKLRRRVARSG